MNTKHPYRVIFTLPRSVGFTLRVTILAETSGDAKASICRAYSVKGNEATVVSARKVTLSKAAFYRKFGEQAMREYFTA